MYRTPTEREEQSLAPIECVVSPTYRHDFATNRTLPIYDGDEDPPALRCVHCHSWFHLEDEDDVVPQTRSFLALIFAGLVGGVCGGAIVTVARFLIAFRFHD